MTISVVSLLKVAGCSIKVTQWRDTQLELFIPTVQRKKFAALIACEGCDAEVRCSATLASPSPAFSFSPYDALLTLHSGRPRAAGPVQTTRSRQRHHSLRHLTVRGILTNKYTIISSHTPRSHTITTRGPRPAAATGHFELPNRFGDKTHRHFGPSAAARVHDTAGGAPARGGGGTAQF
ncbi:hypothetical protein EVAR_25229_1 [Eumeta japonica]|uniref:Uncharacterized protein n=1 Tax=Eumeta variegata TaxID=151549 RepID=A0A4C1WJ61_EUMVA|nr:hypothetical protein EVAR_25229_1 [Eumeta japonica]